MIKFVVVDDNAEYRKKIKEIIDRVIFKTPIEYSLELYNKYTSALAKEIDDCSVQKVYILDIELDSSKSGLDIAKEIRSKDWDSEIIFITSHDKMFETVYRNVFKIFDFIEKFLAMSERIERDITLIVAQKSDHGKFSFVSNKISMQIYYKDITYIYRDTSERKLVIRTSNNNFFLNTGITDILEQLDDRFIQVHRACIVNTQRVTVYNWVKGYFILDTGEKIDMCSKTYKENVYE